MKAISLLVVCAAVFMTGCATTTSPRDIDAAKIDAINRVATSRGVDVHWVNYPQRRDGSPSVAPSTGT